MMMKFVCVTGWIAAITAATLGAEPAAYWSCNEQPGTTTLHDGVGAAHGMVLVDGLQGEAKLVDSGAGATPSGYGKAVTLDETDRVSIGHPEAIQFGKGDFAVTGWLSVGRVDGDVHRVVFDNAQHRQGGYAVLVCRSGNSQRGKLVFDVKGTDKGDISVTSDERIDDGQWHHFAAVVRGQTAMLYVDGVKQATTKAYEPGTTATSPAAFQAAIGARFIGSLDDVAVFAGTMTDEQVAQVYAEGLAAFGHAPDQPAPSDAPQANAIAVTETVVFDGHAGWVHDGVTYRLAVGVIMAQASNGDLLLAWTTGSDKEPADDNCGVLSRSTDGGKTWTEPVVLVPAKDGMQGVITNLYRTKDGRVVLYGAHLPPEDRYTTWHYFRMTSDDDGLTWSDPEPFHLRDGHGSLGQGEIPLDLADGRVLYVGHWYKRRPSPLAAPAANLAHAKTLAEAEAMPVGEGRTAGAFADFLQGIQAYAAPDDCSTTFEPLGSVFDRPLGLIEPTTIRLHDGTIAVLMRADWGGFLWRTDSHDDGKTWSKAYQTDIPNPSSMVDLVRLADGRIGLILNPSGGVVGERAKRDPLAIWISDDEMKTWSVKQNLITGGQLAYPDSIVLDDGNLVFAYDRDRRQVRFVRVQLDTP